MLWRQEARALGRSPQHIASIQRAIDAFDREGVDGAVLPDIFMAVRNRDRAEFYRLACELIGA